VSQKHATWEVPRTCPGVRARADSQRNVPARRLLRLCGNQSGTSLSADRGVREPVCAAEASTRACLMQRPTTPDTCFVAPRTRCTRPPSRTCEQPQQCGVGGGCRGGKGRAAAAAAEQGGVSGSRDVHAAGVVSAAGARSCPNVHGHRDFSDRARWGKLPFPDARQPRRSTVKENLLIEQTRTCFFQPAPTLRTARAASVISVTRAKLPIP